MGSDEIEGHFNILLWGTKSQDTQTLSTDYNFWRERRVEADLNWCSSAYQPNALLLGQTSSRWARSTAVQVNLLLRHASPLAALDFNWLRNTSFCPAKGADEFSHFKIVGGGGGGGLQMSKWDVCKGVPWSKWVGVGEGWGLGGGGGLQGPRGIGKIQQRPKVKNNFKKNNICTAFSFS